MEFGTSVYKFARKFGRKAISLLDYNEQLSTCSEVQVGAVLMTLDGRVIAEAYNGTPSGWIECKWFKQNVIDKLIEYGLTPEQLILEFDQLWSEAQKQIEEFERYGWGSKPDNPLAKVWLNLIEQSRNRSIEFVEHAFNDFIEHYRQLSKRYQSVATKPPESEIASFYNPVHSKYEIHAEQNLIYQLRQYPAYFIGSNQFILFVSHSPCFECSKVLHLLLGDSLKYIVYKHEYRDKRWGQSTVDSWFARNWQFIPLSEFASLTN